MAEVKYLKSRIKGIRGTQKITKAMKTISLIRLQKAETKALSSRPYVIGALDIVSHIEADSIYFTGNKSKDVCFVIFTSDRGLCGSFNDNLLKLAEMRIEEQKKKSGVKLILIGTKAVLHFYKKGYEIVSQYSHLPPDPTVSLSNLVMSDCKKLFLDKKAGEVILIYNNFKSKIKYDIKVKRLLPVASGNVSVQNKNQIFLYEPNNKKVVNTIMEMYLESTVFHSFLDLYASEYSARLVAMSKATDSADEMIGDLTLLLNKTRQAQITTEILEVISGAGALGGTK